MHVTRRRQGRHYRLPLKTCHVESVVSSARPWKSVNIRRPGRKYGHRRQSNLIVWKPWPWSDPLMRRPPEPMLQNLTWQTANTAFLESLYWLIPQIGLQRAALQWSILFRFGNLSNVWGHLKTNSDRHCNTQVNGSMHKWFQCDCAGNKDAMTGCCARSITEMRSLLSTLQFIGSEGIWQLSRHIQGCIHVRRRWGVEAQAASIYRSTWQLA